MRSPSPAGASPAARPCRLRRAARLAAPTLAAATAATLAVAAFTDDATNAGNRATAADVTITADRAASSPLFDLADWRPDGDGASVSRCIGVTNGGSIPLGIAVRLGAAPSGRLAGFVDVDVDRGTRAPADDSAGCDGFLKEGDVWSGELDAMPSAAGTAVPDGGARLAVGAERAYRITWTLQDDEDAEGLSVSGVDFRWETTSAGS